MFYSGEIYALGVAVQLGVVSREAVYSPAAQGTSPLSVSQLVEKKILDHNQWRRCWAQAQRQPNWPLSPTSFERDNRELYRRLKEGEVLDEKILDQAYRYCLQQYQSGKEIVYLDHLLVEKGHLAEEKRQVVTEVPLHLPFSCSTCQMTLSISRPFPWTSFPCPLCSQTLTPTEATSPREKTRDQSTPPTTNAPSILPDSEIEISPTSSRGEGDPSLPEPGHSFGRYEILSELGRGGMGAVFKARDPHLDREVALKVILGPAAREERHIKRFHREAKLAAALNHPHIAPLFEFGEWKGTHFFTQAYVPGTDLRKYVQDRGPLDEKEALAIVEKVCQAVVYAHEEEVVHRDIKPPNIMLENGEKPLLMDFGLAMDTREEEKGLTKTGAIVGSPEYMSPEQAFSEKEKVGFPCDIYALGGVLFFLLTGRPPFEGRDVMVILMQVIKQPPPAVRSLSPEVSREVETIVAKCLEKDPGERYPTAAMLHLDLRAALAGDPIMAQPPNLWKKAKVFYRRNKAFAVSVVLLPILVLISLWVASWWSRQSSVLESLEKAEVALEGTETAKELEKKYLADQKLDRSLPLEVERSLQGHLEKYLEARTLLEQAYRSGDGDEEIRDKLVVVVSEMGEIALLLRNYSLSRIAFERLATLEEKEESKRLLDRLDKRKNALRKQEEERVDEIMTEMAGGKKPGEGMVDEWVTELVRMRGSHVVKKLLPWLEKTEGQDFWPRMVAVKALGKMGDTTTEYREKDAVEWLMERLEQVDPQEDQLEAVALIWALGRLGDRRAGDLVVQVRYKQRPASAFWQLTKAPSRWLPTAGKEGVKKDRQWLTRGLQNVEKGNLDQALDDFSRAIQLNPQNAMAYQNRGAIYQKQGRLSKALDEFNRALEINSKLLEARLHRGVIFAKMKKYQQAIQEYNRVLQLQPNYGRGYFLRAFAHVSQKNYDRALDDLTRAVEANPQYTQAYFQRGNIYMLQNDYQRGLEDFNRALKINPRYVRALVSRGNIHRRQKNFDRALADYNRVIELQPKVSESYVHRGEMYMRMGKVERARKDFAQAVELDPESVKGHLGLGDVCREKKQWALARNHYRQALKLNSQSKLVHSHLGILYLRKKEYDRARKSFHQALKIDPQYAEVYSHLGNVYYEKGLYQKVVKVCSRAVQINHQLWVSYYYRGLAYKKLGKYLRARRDFTRALELNRQHYWSYVNRGEIHYLKKRYTQAWRDYSRAVQIKPDLAPGYANRGVVYYRGRKYKKALSDYNRALQINPQLYKTYLNRGLVYYRQQKYPQALSDYNRALKINSKFSNGYLCRANLHFREKRYSQALSDYTEHLKLSPRSIDGCLYRGLTYVRMEQPRRAVPDFRKFLRLHPNDPRAGKIRTFLQKYDR